MRHLYLVTAALLLALPLLLFVAAVAADEDADATRRDAHLRGVPQLGSRFNAALESSLLHDTTIFIGIAAFRDVECMPCVRDAFAKAFNPRRLFLGIIEQNEHGDPTCIPDEFFNCRSNEFCPLDNIRRRRVAARRGKGPTYGRFVSMLSYRGESFYMMIDSHNEFLLNFDVVSITQNLRARSPRPVQSHYPNGWDKNGQTYESQGHMMVMCKGIFVEHLGYVRNGARWMSQRLEPRLVPNTAAGYLFADARLVHEAPFDPYLDYIFDGEELIYTLRLWTKGWDAFTPGYNTVFHDYNRHKATRFWAYSGAVPGFNHEMTVSQKRAQYMAEVLKKGPDGVFRPLIDRQSAPARVFEKLDVYGLGNVRTVAEYYTFSDVDMEKKKAGERYCDWLDKEDVKFANAPVR